MISQLPRFFVPSLCLIVVAIVAIVLSEISKANII